MTYVKISETVEKNKFLEDTHAEVFRIICDKA